MRGRSRKCPDTPCRLLRAAAEDALIVIPDKARIRIIYFKFAPIAVVLVFRNAHLIAELLELALAALDAGEALLS